MTEETGGRFHYHVVYIGKYSDQEMGAIFNTISESGFRLKFLDDNFATFEKWVKEINRTEEQWKGRDVL